MAKVKVYSTPTCPWCVKTKEFLTENKVEYEDINVAADQKSAQEMLTKSGQMAVPATDTNAERLVGFDKKRLKKALKIA